jgi:hypothetical protein
VCIPTGEIREVSFRTAFRDYLDDKELTVSAVATRTRTRNSKAQPVAEQQLVAKQQPLPKQQLVATQQPVAKQQSVAKNGEGVASTKKAPTSTSLPVGVLPKVVVCDPPPVKAQATNTIRPRPTNIEQYL